MMDEQACPGSDEIRAFLNSQSTADRDRWLSLHIDDCPQCCEAMTIIATHDATVSGSDLAHALDAMQSLPSPCQFENEDGCSDAVERARAISERASETGLDRHELNSAQSPVVNKRLGPYEVDAQIGSGGMGAVYRARHTKLGRTVAIKILHQRRLHQPEAVARFEREMKAIGQLEHPNIVRATDADEHDGVHYLVMEYIDGIDLSQLVRRCGPLPVADACELVRQAAEGLQFAHENGLIHRDIKPANLMLSHGTPGASDRNSPTVRILDLGLALLENPAGEESLTSTDQVMGTIEYMAPEQLDETHQVDTRADVYSLGATLYKLLTGRAPIDDGPGRSQLQKLKALATGKRPAVTDYRSDLPPGLAEAISRMMVLNVNERYSTPADVVGVLAPYCQGADLAGLCERATQPQSDTGTHASVPVVCHPAKPQAKRKSNVVPAVCLAVMVVGAAFWGAIELLVRSPEGTVVLEVNDPKLIGSIVTVDEEKVVIIRDAPGRKPLKISADGNERMLRVVRDGIPVFAQKLKLKPDETRSIVVTWKPPQRVESTVDIRQPVFVDSGKRPGAKPAATPPKTFESMISEPGWRVKQVVQFEEPVDAAVINPHNGNLYCVMLDSGLIEVRPDGTRRRVLEQFTPHPAFAFERNVLFYSGLPGGNFLGVIDLNDGTEISRIDCSAGDNDIGTIAFAPPGFVPELLGPDQGLTLDVGHRNPMAVFRFDWKTDEVESIVENAEILKSPEGPYAVLTIGRDTIYLANASHLFRLEGSRLVQLPVELKAISDIAFDPVTNDLLVQANKGVVRVDPSGDEPVREVFRNVSPAWSNRLRFSPDGKDLVLCDVPNRRVYVFTRDAQQPARREQNTNRRRPDVPERLPPPLDQNQQSCSFTADELTVVFASPQTGSLGGSDLWIAERRSTALPFSAARNLGQPINTVQSEYSGCLSRDGLTLVYASNCTESQERGPARIWMATRPGRTEPFSQPTRLPLLEDIPDDERWVSYPSLSADSTELFFSAATQNSRDTDLYVATREDTAKDFGPARRLSSGINTSSPEMYPALHPGGRVLVFSSTRDGGLGVHDLWAARRSDVGSSFGKAVHLGRVINSPRSETAPFISADGATLYFTAKEAAQKNGQTHLYRVAMPQLGNPELQ